MRCSLMHTSGQKGEDGEQETLLRGYPFRTNYLS